MPYGARFFVAARAPSRSSSRGTMVSSRALCYSHLSCLWCPRSDPECEWSNVVSALFVSRASVVNLSFLMGRHSVRDVGDGGRCRPCCLVVVLAALRRLHRFRHSSRSGDAQNSQLWDSGLAAGKISG